MNIKCGFVCFTRHCTPGPCPEIVGRRSYSGLDSVSLAFWKAAFRALPLGGSQSLMLIPTFCTEILLLMGWTKKVKSYFSFKILEFSGSISGTIKQFSTWKSSQHFVWERVSACGKGLLLSPPQDLKTRMCNVHICRHKTIVQGCVFVTTRPGCTHPASQPKPFECKTMHLFHHHGHILQFGDQLMERLLGAITRSGYVVGGASIWIQSVRLFSCEERLIDLELLNWKEMDKGRSLRQCPVWINQMPTGRSWIQRTHICCIIW